jgi:NAD(P)-dependent dehydrogenase (short-subunit alcohol dehydrogenase family)
MSGTDDEQDARPTALVTGGSRGIGRATVTALAAAGYDVVVGGTTPDGVAAVVEQVPGSRPFVVDLTDEEATTAAVADLGLDRLDVLVNNAGVAPMGRLQDTTAADWRTVLDVNIVAVATLTRLLLEPLRSARGTVVMINSGAGLNPNAGLPAYVASKFALTGFTDSLRLDLAPDGVRVVSVHPGPTDTRMQEDLQAFYDRDYDPAEHLTPGDVADAVLHAVTQRGQLTTLSLRPPLPR